MLKHWLMADVQLKNGHLIIGAALAGRIFGLAEQVDWVYYSAEGKLLAAPHGDEVFRQLHKTRTSMLKHKNSQGDRSMSVQELLLDEAIDPSDRDIAFKTEDAPMQLLNISLMSQ